MDKFLDEEIILLNSRLKDAITRLESFKKRQTELVSDKDKADLQKHLDLAKDIVANFQSRIAMINDIKLEKDNIKRKKLLEKYLDIEIIFTQRGIECSVTEKEFWEKSEVDCPQYETYPKYKKYKEEELMRIEKETQEYQERLEKLQQLKENM